MSLIAWYLWNVSRAYAERGVNVGSHLRRGSHSYYPHDFGKKMDQNEVVRLSFREKMSREKHVDSITRCLIGFVVYNCNLRGNC